MAAKTVPQKANSESAPSFRPISIVIILALLGAGFVWWFYLRGGSRSLESNPLTPEMKTYVKSLKLSDVGMKATENYVKHTIVEITGNISNQGERVLKVVEINCVFYDNYGQVVLRQRLPIVRMKDGPLRPGESRSFRLPFDNLPESWNQGMPQMVIAFIAFES